jgi:hypothetical protein
MINRCLSPNDYISIEMFFPPNAVYTVEVAGAVTFSCPSPSFFCSRLYMYTLTSWDAAAAPRKALHEARLDVSVAVEIGQVQDVLWFDDEAPACPDNTGTHEC